MFAIFLPMCVVGRIFIVPYIENPGRFSGNSSWNVIDGIADAIDKLPRVRLTWPNINNIVEGNFTSFKNLSQIEALVKSGRLEFVNGLLSNTETYIDLENAVRIFEEASNVIKNTFGIDGLDIAWSSNPGRHSSLTPVLLEKLGYKFCVLTEIPTKKDVNNNLESSIADQKPLFWWKGTSLGAHSQILTYANYKFSDFSKALNSNDSIKGNVDNLEKAFTKINHNCCDEIIFVKIDEFCSGMENITNIFEILDGLAEKDYTISTLSEYFREVTKEKHQYELREGEITFNFDNPLEIIPNYKVLPSNKLQAEIHKSQSLARAAEISNAFISNSSLKIDPAFFITSESTLQGHFSINSIDPISNATRFSFTSISTAYNHMVRKQNSTVSNALNYKAFTVYNSLSWEYHELISFKSISKHIEIIGGSNQTLPSQVVCQEGEYLIYFRPKLKPLSFTTFFVLEYNNSCEKCGKEAVAKNQTFLENDKIKLFFQNGQLINISEITGSEAIQNTSLVSSYMIYNSSNLQHIINSTEIVLDCNHSIFEGELFSISLSTFRYNTSIINQTVMLDKQSRSFMINFKISSASQNVDLRLSPIQSNPGLLLFNTADVRKYSYKSTSNLTENNFPIPGSIILQSNKTFIQIYPSQRTNIKISNNSLYDITLYDSHNRSNPAEIHNELLIEFAELNGSMWKKYFTNKHRPLVFGFVGEDMRISPDTKEMSEYHGKWPIAKEYHLAKLDECFYLSKIMSIGVKYAVDIVNVCSKSVKFEMEDVEVGVVRNCKEETKDNQVTYLEEECKEAIMKPYSFISFEVNVRYNLTNREHAIKNESNSSNTTTNHTQNTTITPESPNNGTAKSNSTQNNNSTSTTESQKNQTTQNNSTQNSSSSANSTSQNPTHNNTSTAPSSHNSTSSNTNNTPFDTELTVKPNQDEQQNTFLFGFIFCFLGIIAVFLFLKFRKPRLRQIGL